MSTTTLYKIPTPYSMGSPFIELDGEPENGWYEWRVLDAGGVGLDTGTEGTAGRQYGNAEIALRDALIATSE